MNIQPVDFPSDSLGETFNLRTELLKCLQKSEASRTAKSKFKEVLAFTLTKLKELDAEQATVEEPK